MNRSISRLMKLSGGQTLHDRLVTTEQRQVLCGAMCLAQSATGEEQTISRAYIRCEKLSAWLPPREMADHRLGKGFFAQAHRRRSNLRPLRLNPERDPPC